MQPGRFIIIRGLPGSGKSTEADRLASQSVNSVVISTDTPIEGVSDPSTHPFRMGLAYDAALRDAKRATSLKAPMIIIDHTNVTNWEMRGFAEIAQTRGYGIEITEPQTKWAKDPSQCYLHCQEIGVTPEDIQQMAFTWEPALPIPEMLKAPTPLDRRAEYNALMDQFYKTTDVLDRLDIAERILGDFGYELVDNRQWGTTRPHPTGPLVEIPREMEADILKPPSTPPVGNETPHPRNSIEDTNKRTSSIIEKFDGITPPQYDRDM